MTRFKREAHCSVVLTNIRPPFLAWTTSLRPESVYVHIGAVVPHCVIMLVNWCSLATDGVMAYVPPLCPPPSRPSLTMDASARVTFLFFFISCQRQNSSMKWIIISETSNCKTTNGLTFFWFFKGKRFCLIKLYKDGTSLFWKVFFYFKRTKNSVKL